MSLGIDLQVEDFERIFHDLICARLGELCRPLDFLDERGKPRGGTAIGDSGYPVRSIVLTELVGEVDEMFHLFELGNEDNLFRYRTLSGWAEQTKMAWDRGARRIFFKSSGSTGEAVRLGHDFSLMSQEIGFWASHFSQVKRVVSLVPCHHIYGFLFTVLLPKALGCDWVEARFWSPRGLMGRLRPGDLVVGFPDRWRGLSSSSWPELVEAVTSTAPCPPTLIDSLRDHGLMRMTEVYGSSETAGIGMRTAVEKPYELLPYWRHDAGKDELIRSEGTQERRFSVPDLLRWTGDRCFRVEGRKDGAVQVAGKNVYPARVAQVLAQYPGVEACSVRLMNPSEGNRLKAFVVMEEHIQGNPVPQLFAWCGDQLEDAEIPAHFKIGKALPRNEMGKLKDWSL